MCEIRTLRADEIEVKIKQVTASGAIALLYKTSRTDMTILDETFGKFNWTDDYRDIDGVLYCGIGIRASIDKPFVWKWSNGIESRKDDEGNEVKGEASDAFKRAGFMVGIGRELYTAPFVFIKAETAQKPGGKGYDLVDKYVKYTVADIGYDETRHIDRLIIENQYGDTVFTFGARKVVNRTSDDKKKALDAAIKKVEQTTITPKALKEDKDILPWEARSDDEIDEQVVDDIWSTAQMCGITEKQVFAMIKRDYDKDIPEELNTSEANDFIRRCKEYKESKGGKVA